MAKVTARFTDTITPSVGGGDFALLLIGAFASKTDTAKKAKLVLTLEEYQNIYGTLQEIDDNGVGKRSAGWTGHAFAKAYLEAGHTNLLIYNLLNADDHGTQVTDESVTLTELGQFYALANKTVAPGTVVVTNSAGTTTYTEGTDYEIDYIAGKIKGLSGGGITAGDSVLVSYKYLDPTTVTDNQAAAAIGTAKEAVFPEYGIVFSKIHAPVYSKKETVRTALQNAHTYNEVFYCSSAYDIDESTVTEPVDIATLATLKTHSTEWLEACFNSNTKNELLMSDFLMLQYAENAFNNGGVPSDPTSNHGLTEYEPAFKYGLAKSNAIAAIGIVNTCKLGIEPWVLWSDNRTSYYNGTASDYDKDNATARDMRNYMANAIIKATFKAYIAKKKITPPLIKNIINDVNAFGRTLVGNYDQLDFEVYIIQAENPLSDLLNGKVKFRIRHLTPPPFNVAEFIFATDFTAIQTIFS